MKGGPHIEKDYQTDEIRGSRYSAEQGETTTDWGENETSEFGRGDRLFRGKELDTRAGCLGNSESSCLAPAKFPAGMGGKVSGPFCGGLDFYVKGLTLI